MRRLTEKRLKNRSYRSTEETIILTYWKIRDHLSPSHLIRSARISRSTFYRHHQDIGHIALDYETYIYRKARAALARLLRMKRIRLRILYERLLVLISINGSIFAFLLEFGSPDFLTRLILILEPKILSTTRLSSREALNVYVGEIASLIKSWRPTNFDRTEIPTLVEKITYLTDTASLRLRHLSQIDHKHNS